MTIIENHVTSDDVVDALTKLTFVRTVYSEVSFVERNTRIAIELIQKQTTELEMANKEIERLTNLIADHNIRCYEAYKSRNEDFPPNWLIDY